MSGWRKRGPGQRIGVACGGVACLLMTGAVQAWGDCEHERKLEETMRVSGDTLAIVAGAGDLDVVGDEAADVVDVRARICASKAEWAEEAGVAMSGDGDPRVEVLIPGTAGWGDHYVRIDLVVRVPAGLALDVKDSSGDVDMRGVGAVSVRDSSGDIEIQGAESVVVEDSSGDIELEQIAGDVTVVQDSSGDISGRNVGGSVVVTRDSSGDIRFRDVRGDFLVERDSSGDVVAQGVGGDFTVLKDGSGEIRHSDVMGSVAIPEDR